MWIRDCEDSGLKQANQGGFMGKWMYAGGWGWYVKGPEGKYCGRVSGVVRCVWPREDLYAKLRGSTE